MKHSQMYVALSMANTSAFPFDDDSKRGKVQIFIDISDKKRVPMLENVPPKMAQILTDILAKTRSFCFDDESQLPNITFAYF